MKLHSPLSLVLAFVCLTQHLSAKPYSAPLTYTEKRSSTFFDRQKRFIGELFRQKEYFLCIGETRRLLQYVNNSSQKSAYLYFIDVNYYLGHQYKTVIAHYHRAVKPEYKLSLLASASYQSLGRTADALDILENLYDTSPGTNHRRDIILRKVDLYMHENRIGNSIAELDKYCSGVKSPCSYNNLRKDLANYTKLNFRSPVTAAVLSGIVPGAGQAYSGRYRDGLVSFIAMGALIAATCLSFSADRTETGFTLAFFSTLVYTGNVYGGYNSAQHHNRCLLNQFSDTVRRKHIPPYDPGKYLNADVLF